ncbi:tetratricopeptide repeat protein [Hyalangium rubrum]|uniref:Tetratricopeptide repeat protein n=1 Tax=Hyalangium rubrum TaxID=3103134 RepID=A0ABU5H0H2_9BACT|nr:tetratricopeptide repeat protein [Hyalangium sp. s54d21]MDY7226801.1 tetratricopeptide repeat protein [Hyalangium sp. s54d21]
MSKWLLWMLLTSLTGRPIVSLVLVLVGVWAVDRFTFQFLPSPLRVFGRWRRAGQLERMLLANPHDRRARYELADLRIGRGRYKDAVEVLKPNLEAGDDDVDTLFLLGVAYLGAGEVAKGELLLDEAKKLNPDYRHGAIDLERGRLRLAHGNARGAVEALESFVKGRHGTVEGRVLLAKALDKTGRDADAALMRDDAWKEYVAAPGFQRRRERMWAWRARPSRPLTYAAVALGVLALSYQVLSRVQPPMQDPHAAPYSSASDSDFEE